MVADRGGYKSAQLSPSLPSRRTPLVVPLGALLAVAMVLMVSASVGSTRVVLSDVVGGAVESPSGTGEREGTEVEGLQ